MQNNLKGYDIIGDLHGCHDKLAKLIQKLGYDKNLLEKNSHKKNLMRKIIFVGDLLDRGEKIPQTLFLVKQLIENGLALSVLGNHETLMMQAYLDAGKNLFQSPPDYLSDVHFTTLEAFSSQKSEFFEILDWFFELPLALEFENFRVVHASWRESLMAEFFAKYKNGIVDADFFIKAKNNKTWEKQVLETATQGMRFKFDAKITKTHKEFIRGRKFRAKFWLKNPKTYGDVFFHPFALPNEISQKNLTPEIKKDIEIYTEDRKHLFVGHYWLNGDLKILAPNIACVDFSAVKGGPLVAYRFSGEQVLTNSNFVF